MLTMLFEIIILLGYAIETRKHVRDEDSRIFLYIDMNKLLNVEEFGNLLHTGHDHGDL